MQHPVIHETNVQHKAIDKFYRGKVRDVYTVGDHLIMVASDRISAFDHILPRPIPYKGAVLNQTAAHFLKATRDIVPNWLLDTPHPNISVGVRCEPIPIEMVVRGHLCGHAWRLYKSGVRTICGVVMPDGLKENDVFPQPIITPATKAESGHDEDISRHEIIEKGIMSKRLFDSLAQISVMLFERGSKMAAQRGLLLADTKYEFGLHQGAIMLMDEVHTPDSSRYFYQSGFAERQSRGEPQKQLSKEFVRKWLMDNGFQGLEGQMMPQMPDEFVQSISGRYIELYETVTGSRFIPSSSADLKGEIESTVVSWAEQLERKP